MEAKLGICMPKNYTLPPTAQPLGVWCGTCAASMALAGDRTLS